VAPSGTAKKPAMRALVSSIVFDENDSKRVLYAEATAGSKDKGDKKIRTTMQSHKGRVCTIDLWAKCDGGDDGIELRHVESGSCFGKEAQERLMDHR